MWSSQGTRRARRRIQRGIRLATGYARFCAPLALLLALFAPTGCAFFAPPQVSITGHVYGVPLLSAARAGQERARGPEPLRASVRCNKSQTTAGADGAFKLSVDQASQYACTVSAPTYVATTLTISGSAGTKLTLDLGSASSTTMPSCGSPITSASALCAPLQLQPATLSGKITLADTGQSGASQIVTCWQPGASTGPQPTLETATTDPTGAFTLSRVPPGPYACRVGTGTTLYQGNVQPGGTASLAMQVCSRHCAAVTFHNGAVMHAMAAYLVFWLPKGAHFEPSSVEPSGSDKRFESLMAQYMNDIGGSRLYGLLGQYWDFGGSIQTDQNSMTLGGTYLDTTPYPHAGSRADPLSSDNIEHQIGLDIAHNHWTADGEHEVFIFTGYNTQSCTYASSGKECSFGRNGHSYCAYHSDFPLSGGRGNAIYAYVPVIAECARLDELSLYGSPNKDSIADAIINALSHEHFESVSDPSGHGWYDEKPDTGEIADKCEYTFGSIRSDGSNVTLGHGHNYLLQEEWSDESGGCALQ